MEQQTRSKARGAIHFFTVRLADRKSTLLVDNVDLLRQTMRLTMQRYPFEIDAIVILPSTIHTLWTLPKSDTDVRARWHFLKSAFSRALPMPEDRAAVQKSRKEKGIWQSRFWEHRISSKQDLALHRYLIRTAPVQNGLASKPEDWTWTSLHRDLANCDTAVKSKRPERFNILNLKAKVSAL